MENLSKNTKIIIVLGLLGLSYYLWNQQKKNKNTNLKK
jgi:hypothetical protein